MEIPRNSPGKYTTFQDCYEESPQIFFSVPDSLTCICSRVGSFTVLLRLICHFRKFSLLRQWGLITVLSFVLSFLPLVKKNLRILLCPTFVSRCRFNHMVIHAIVCDWTTWTNNLLPFFLGANLLQYECISTVRQIQTGFPLHFKLGVIWSYSLFLYPQCIAAYKRPCHFWGYRLNFGCKKTLCRV